MQTIKKLKNVKHFISSNFWWVSSWNYKSLNLALHTKDKKENVIENRKILAKNFWENLDNFIFMKQIHSDKIVVVWEKNKWNWVYDEKNAIIWDAIITNKKWIILVVLVADCVPIILYDKKNKVIWVVHAGWRWTQKKILKKTIEKFVKNFNSKTKNIIVWIWPHISKKNYEVWEKVFLQFEKKFYKIKKKSENKKAFLNLEKANISQLIEMWIAKKNIKKSKICSFENKNLFSARKFWVKSGRFWMWIML